MLVIDGSQGEGGGQILRSSLSLAMVTGTPFTIENIRANRSKPGLMRQHLACVKAAQAVSGAEVSGAALRSTKVVFKPGVIQGGEYEFAVGTAGSTSLIFQTVLPALGLVNQESRIRFYGGTHNMLAPSVDFIEHAFLPLLSRMGMDVSLKLERHGFYPQGGGEWQVVIKPFKRPGRLELPELDHEPFIGCAQAHRARAVITSANLPDHVSQREQAAIVSRCRWLDTQVRCVQVEAHGGGNMVSLRVNQGTHWELFEEAGKNGVPAERVVKKAVNALRRFEKSAAQVGEYLADQLLLPLLIAGSGCFTTVAPSTHLRTNIDVLELFTGKRFGLVEQGKDLWQVSLR